MEADLFEQLYAEHAVGLLGFLVYRTGDRGLSEDLLADTFERVLRSRSKFDSRRGSGKSWLYSIALNLLRDHQRRAAVESRALEGEWRGGEDDAALDPGIGLVEQRDLLTRSLAKLSPEEREALALRFGGDLTAPEIAELLGEKLTTVEGRVYRALRKLRDELPEVDARER